MLCEEHEQRGAVPELLQHGGNDHHSEAVRIACDDYEGELPHDGRANEAVIKRGMSDRRRILATDKIEHEIQRREDEDAPDGGNRENYFSEFHFVTLAKSLGQNLADIACPEPVEGSVGPTRTLSTRRRRRGHRLGWPEPRPIRGTPGHWRFRKC